MSYMEIADAPWIREAERFGMPSYPDPKCPMCYDEPASVAYYDVDTGAEVGCDCCIERRYIDQEETPEFFPVLEGPQPEDPDPVCPCCGKIPDDVAYYYKKGHTALTPAILGCDRCIEARDINDVGKNPTFYDN